MTAATADQDCIYVQAVTITPEGDDTGYALNHLGELVPSGPDVTTNGCGANSSTSPGQVSPMVIPYGSKDLTSGSSAYAKTDTNGIFSSQVAPGSVALAWAYSISPRLQAISAGSATATVTRAPGNCDHHKTGVTTAYLFHGSCPSHVYSNPYSLNGLVAFPIQVSGVPGTAEIK